MPLFIRGRCLVPRYLLKNTQVAAQELLSQERRRGCIAPTEIVIFQKKELKFDCPPNPDSHQPTSQQNQQIPFGTKLNPITPRHSSSLWLEGGPKVKERWQLLLEALQPFTACSTLAKERKEDQDVRPRRARPSQQAGEHRLTQQVCGQHRGGNLYPGLYNHPSKRSC